MSLFGQCHLGERLWVCGPPGRNRGFPLTCFHHLLFKKKKVEKIYIIKFTHFKGETNNMLLKYTSAYWTVGV